MMAVLAAVALELIVLHTLDGRDVYINSRHIVTISEAREETDPHKRLTGKVHCVVTLSDSKFISVAETCESIRLRLQEAKQ